MTLQMPVCEGWGWGQGLILRKDLLSAITESLLMNVKVRCRLKVKMAVIDLPRIVQMSIGLFLILVAGCVEKAPQNPPQPIPEVEVMTITAHTVADEPEFIGRTEAFRPVEIRPQ